MPTLDQMDASPRDVPGSAATPAPARRLRLFLAPCILAVALFSFWLGARLGPLALAGQGDGLSQGTWLPTPVAPMAYVGGAVRHPGLYALTPNARVADLLRRAGGPTGAADLTRGHLDAPLRDGETLTIPLHRGQTCGH